MKLSELLKALEGEMKIHGDLNIEICRYSDDEKKYYWASCYLVKGKRFVIGYNVNSLRKMEY